MITFLLNRDRCALHFNFYGVSDTSSSSVSFIAERTLSNETALNNILLYFGNDVSCTFN